MSEPVKALWQDDAALFKAICEYVANERLVDLWEGGLVRQLSGDEQEAFRNAARTLPERLPLATPEMVAVVDKAVAFEKFVNDHGWSRGLGYDCTVTVSVTNGLHGHTALTELLDAARAAGGAHA